MIIFDHGYSTDVDGYGFRLIFYLKGCNLRCDWCGSPESISPEPEMLCYPDRKELSGQTVTPDWIVSKIIRSRHLIDGVTFGGGEPTLQSAELLQVLHNLKAEKIHTALESNASTENYPEIAMLTDQLFSDLKTLSEEKFISLINPNLKLLAKIRGNLRFAALNHPALTIRIPVVSGLNDQITEQHKIAVFLAGIQAENGNFQVQLLRQHHFAEPKYNALNRVYLCKNAALPEKSVMEKFLSILEEYGIKVLPYESIGN